MSQAAVSVTEGSGLRKRRNYRALNPTRKKVFIAASAKTFAIRGIPPGKPCRVKRIPKATTSDCPEG